MATKNEYTLVLGLYRQVVGRTIYMIDKSEREAKEMHPDDPAFENGSALTSLYRKYYREATDEINDALIWDDENNCAVIPRNQTENMLKAIDILMTHVI